MIRISISFFYRMGAAMRAAKALSGPIDLRTAWGPLTTVKGEVESLFATSWFAPAIRTAYVPGQELLNAIRVITDRTDFDAIVDVIELFAVQNALEEFETVIRNELHVADAYFVSRKGGYDSGTLISNAENCFPKELITKIPNAIPDVREAGKCLAFELSTACGFHILRAVETVVQTYWTAVSGGKPHPRPKTLGAYLKRMEEMGIGNKKARAALAQIKDLHRNPLMHPQDSLNLDEAVSLFGVSNSAISAMLKDIPVSTPSP